jgi:hypothetical protein
MRKVLYTSYYHDKNAERQKELLHCLTVNVENKDIDEVVLFIEGKAAEYPELTFKKVTIIEAPRPRFKDFFDVINVFASDNDISIIANSDIYFDRTIRYIKLIDMDNTCLALSRHHYYSKDRIELHNEAWSQDVWIFKGKVKPMNYSEFHLGIPGTDNRIAYEIGLAGYKLLNPSKSIRCIHFHMSEVRNYYHLGKIQKPYMSVPVTDIFIEPSQGTKDERTPSGVLKSIDGWTPKARKYNNTILKTW